MHGIIREMDKLSKERLKTIIEQTKNGKALVAYNSTFIPEELIRASGADTYLLCRGGNIEAAEVANDYLLRFINPLARSMVGYMELGRDEIMQNADLVVTAQTDCHIGRTSELLEFRGMNVLKVGVPANWKKEIAFEYYLNSLRKMLKAIEKSTGSAVDMDLARENFRQSNKINSCFKKINELRKMDEVPIKFEEYMRLQHMSFILGDAALTIEKLEKVYERLKHSPAAFKERIPRLLVLGRAIAVGDYAVFRMLDKIGGVVVAEMLDECIRVTERDVELDGDLVYNFAKNRYKDKQPINIFQPSWELRFQRVKELIEEYRIDGVIWYQLAFDEIYDMEYSCISAWLREMSVPLLKVETDYSYSHESMGQITTRLESFVESLRQD